MYSVVSYVVLLYMMRVFSDVYVLSMPRVSVCLSVCLCTYV